ncbi:hypothetical protein TNCV_4615041 [Trichonephila clavipes]|nr:hypothetical protein TNCV_4615041 [Trichonephila clavipes]
MNNATCLTKLDRGPTNSSRLRARIFTPVVSLSFEHYTGDSTILFGSTLNLKRENPGGGQGLSPFFPFHMRGLAARWLFKVPLCCKSTVHLQTSMSSPRFEPNPYVIAVSVANYCTGWAIIINRTSYQESIKFCI